MRKGSLLCVMYVLTGIASAQIAVNLPTMAGKQGDTVEVPIAVGDLTESEVLAYQFTIVINHTVLNALDVAAQGTLSDQVGWSAVANFKWDSLIVGAFGATPLKGSGTLLKLKCRVVGSSGLATPMKFVLFLFNAGTPTATLANGMFSVVTAVDRNSQTLPANFSLCQNYPNPFNPSTTIQFALPARSFVRLSVFDMLGQVVARIVNEEVEPGIHSMTFDGSKIASGNYLYRIEAIARDGSGDGLRQGSGQEYVEVKTLVLLK